jgi:SsrA-binding protein
MSAAKAKVPRQREIRNASIQRDYFIDETFEAGIVLTGTEVKSIREGRAQINEAFVRLDRGVPILFHAHIAEYSFGSFANHKPYRPRQLLLHKRQILSLTHEMQSGGRALIPARIYFKQALVKVEIALCRGKKQYDKREDLRKKDTERELRRVMSRSLD